MKFRKGDYEILDDVLNCLQGVGAGFFYNVVDHDRFDAMIQRIEEMRNEAMKKVKP